MLRARHVACFALMALFSFCFSGVVLAQTETPRAVPDAFTALDNEVSLQVDNGELIPVLQQLSKQAGVEILLDKSLAGRVASLHIDKKSLREALNQCLDRPGLRRKYTYYTWGNTLHMVLRQEFDAETPLRRDPVVSLDVKQGDLYFALKMLFSQVNVDFTLPPELRGHRVCVRLKQPLRTAVGTVLKAAGLSLTWKYEKGVFSIIPATDAEPMAPMRPPARPIDAFAALNTEVSLDVDNTRLSEALKRLGKQAGVEIRLDKSLADKPLTYYVVRQPLRNALERALDRAGLYWSEYTYIAWDNALCVVPIHAFKPDLPPAKDPIVFVEAKQGDLYEVFRMVFKQIKEDFALSPDLRGTRVTVQLEQPLRSALDSLVKTSRMPIRWRFEYRVFSVEPVEADNSTAPKRQPDKKTPPQKTKKPL